MAKIDIDYEGLTVEQMDRYDYIESLLSENGGWTKASLAKIGVDWPPRKGWLHDYIFGDTTHDGVTQNK